MFTIKTFNNIAKAGLDIFDRTLFEVGPNVNNPHALLVRSHDLHNEEIPDSVELVVRAGAGTNNIPIDTLTQKGIPVLNTPGANANAVKELVLTGMLLACRHICQAWKHVCELIGHENLHEEVEKQKKQFAGFELPGKTLGLIGLGNIGVKVANAAAALDMNVIGYDPAITVQNAWGLNSDVIQADHINDVLHHADFISVHIPLLESTKNLINEITISEMKKGVIILNFARDGIVNNSSLLKALETKKVACYVCDFPETELLNHPNIICLPHLGASTHEAEENCAIMAAHQIIDFFTFATIKHSVNFPNIKLSKTAGHRLAVVNANIPNMVAQLSSTLSHAGLNIIDMINKSRNDIAYTIFDVNNPISQDIISQLLSIDGIIRAKVI